MNNLILDALEQTAARLPEKIAFADEQTEVSFSALVRRAQSVAAALIPLVPPRSVVGFYMDKGVETVVGFMGAVYAGCAYAQLNLRHPAPRVRAMLETLDTPIVVTNRAHLAQLEDINPPARILLIEELEETPLDEDALSVVRADDRRRPALRQFHQRLDRHAEGRGRLPPQRVRVYPLLCGNVCHYGK